MILFLTAIDQQLNQRDFSCQLSSIEDQFDVLNQLVAQGHTLLSAYMLEGDSRTDLPLAAFDGRPVAPGIQTLEQDWKAILAKPYWPTLRHQRGLIELTRRRLTTTNGSIAAHQRMIETLTGWIQRTQATTPSITRYALLRHYDHQLAAQQASLVKANDFAEVAINRLHQLLANS